MHETSGPTPPILLCDDDTRSRGHTHEKASTTRDAHPHTHTLTKGQEGEGGSRMHSLRSWLREASAFSFTDSPADGATKDARCSEGPPAAMR